MTRPRPSSPPGGCPIRTCRPCGAVSSAAGRPWNGSANACGWPMATSSTSTGPACTMPRPRWCWRCTASPGHPVALHLGLRALLERGWASVALNWRGLLGEPNRLAARLPFRVSDDLAEVVAHLRARRPQAPPYAVGIAMARFGSGALKTKVTQTLDKVITVATWLNTCT